MTLVGLVTMSKTAERFWDWATCGGPGGQRLLPYGQDDPDVYVTGGLGVFRCSRELQSE